MAATLQGSTLTLTGEIGSMWGGDDRFDLADVNQALSTFSPSATLNVRINSGGGSVVDSLGIYQTLKGRPGVTNVEILGIAASGGAIISAAGKTVTMRAESLLMIHSAHGITIGTEREMQQAVDEYRVFDETQARIFAAKSGLTFDECLAIVRAETWLDAETALAKGFCDVIASTPSEAVAAFDYRKYAHAPANLCAMASLNKFTPAKPVGKSDPVATARRVQAVASAGAVANMRKVAGIAEPKKPTAVPAAATSAVSNMQALLRGQGRL